MPSLSPSLVINDREVPTNVSSLKLEKLGLFDWALQRGIINPMLNYLFTEKFVEFFRRISGNSIIHNLKEGPGSWKSMLAHYHKTPTGVVDHMVDRYISFSAGLRNRQKLVVNLLTQLIEVYGKERTVHMVEVGSGSANNTIEAIRLARQNILGLKAQLFDLEDDAMVFGRAKVKEMGFENEVSFIQSDANQIEKFVTTPPEIVVMIGLIEYLTDESMEQLFASVARFSQKSSGSIFISSIEPAHGIDRFLRRTLHFNLNYRGPKKLIHILSRFGYKRFSIFPEPTGIFNVIVGHS